MLKSILLINVNLPVSLNVYYELSKQTDKKLHEPSKYWPETIVSHPWARKDLSLKIDERVQTIWNCILEL